MRYFVYKDSQIRGPFAPEELGSGGLTPEALVCAETVSGRHGGDWLTAGEVAELSAFRSSMGASTAVLEEPEISYEVGGLEKLELESLGVPSETEGGEGWLLDIFEDAEFRQRWGDLLPKPSRDPGDLFGAKSKITELTSQIESLQARIKELETGRPGKGAAGQADPLKGLRRPTTSSFAPPPSGAQAEFQSQGTKFTFSGKPKAAPQSGAKPIRFAPSQSFRVIEKEPHPAQAAQDMQTAPPAVSGFPQAGSAPPLAAPPNDFSPPPLPSAPEPSPFPAPQFNAPPTPAPTLAPPPVTLTPSAAPPMTMMFGTPAAAPTPAPAFPAFEAPKLQAPPMPDLSASGGQGLATAVFSGPSVPAPGALTPSRANAGAITSAGPEAGTEDVIARLAKPTAAPVTGVKPQPRRFPTMAVVGVVGVIALVGLVFVFLRNSRGLKSMVAMGTDQKPIGAIPDEEPKAPPVILKPAPQPVPVPTAPAPAAPAPVAGKDMIPDPGEAAITLVKNYPLAGDRNSVGQWLTFEFTANPADGNKELWNAGAVDATTFAVEYHVQPGPKSALKEAVAYLFEADVSRKTVKGSNQAARQLLAGGDFSKPKKVKKPAVRRRVRAVEPPPEPKTVPLLPLPSDSELLPPAADDSSFKTDTVQPGL